MAFYKAGRTTGTPGEFGKEFLSSEKTGSYLLCAIHEIKWLLMLQHHRWRAVCDESHSYGSGKGEFKPPGYPGMAGLGLFCELMFWGGERIGKKQKTEELKSV